MRFVTKSRVLFLQFLVLYVCVAYFYAYGLNIYHNDAISRTALAFFTTFGRDPHLAAIGFVWQPLPSLLQIPLLLLLEPHGLKILAGPIVTAFAGAFAVVVVYKIGVLVLRKRKRIEPSIVPMIVAALFGFNPMIILYSSIGTSEMLFILSVLMATYYYLKWFLHTGLPPLLLGSVYVAVAFWSRYEAIPVFLVCNLLIIFKSFFSDFSLKRIESTLIQCAIPFVYSITIWILLNWFIMKDPFYFLNSPYSNAAFTSIFRSNPAFLEQSYHSIINSFIYVLKRSLYLAPIFATFITLPYFFSKYRERGEKDILLFAFLTFPFLGILAFHMYQLFTGASFGWLRFMMYAIPAGSLSAFYFARKNMTLAIIAILFLAAGIVTTGIAMANPQLGREEASFVEKTINPRAKLDFSRTYEDQKEIAKIMDGQYGRVLLDTDKGFAIPLFAKFPEKYVITSDIDYLKIVKDYSSYVDWIIIPKPAADDRGQNKIYTYYPKIWEGGAPDTQLFKEVADWKIYRVYKKLPQPLFEIQKPTQL